MKFLVRYFNRGDWYSTKINAENWDDAEDICRRHSLQLDGEYKFTLYGIFGQIVAMVIDL